MIPTALVDVQAEQHLAAVATISRAGALQVLERIPTGAFYDRSAWSVIEHATLVADRPDPEALDPIDARIVAVAAAAGVHTAELRDWVADVPVMWDTNGSIASRVLEAAARRQRALELAAELESIVGEPVRFGAAA